jgi:DnaJ domain
MLLKSRRGY